MRVTPLAVAIITAGTAVWNAQLGWALPSQQLEDALGHYLGSLVLLGCSALLVWRGLSKTSDRTDTPTSQGATPDPCQSTR